MKVSHHIVSPHSSHCIYWVDACNLNNCSTLSKLYLGGVAAPHLDIQYVCACTYVCVRVCVQAVRWCYKAPNCRTLAPGIVSLHLTLKVLKTVRITIWELQYNTHKRKVSTKGGCSLAITIRLYVAPLGVWCFLTLICCFCVKIKA